MEVTADQIHIALLQELMSRRQGPPVQWAVPQVVAVIHLPHQGLQDQAQGVLPQVGAVAARGAVTKST